MVGHPTGVVRNGGHEWIPFASGVTNPSPLYVFIEASPGYSSTAPVFNDTPKGVPFSIPVEVSSLVLSHFMKIAFHDEISLDSRDRNTGHEGHLW